MVERCSEAKRPRRELPSVARSSFVCVAALSALSGWGLRYEGCVRHARSAAWRGGEGGRERRDARAESAVGGGTGEGEGEGEARGRGEWWNARGCMRAGRRARRARRRAGREGIAGDVLFVFGAGSSD